MYVALHALLLCLAFGLDFKLLHAQDAETSAEPKETTGASVTVPPHADQRSTRGSSVPVHEESASPVNPTPRSGLDYDDPTAGDPVLTQRPIPDPGSPTTESPKSTASPHTRVGVVRDIDRTEYTTTADPGDKENITTTASGNQPPGPQTTTAARESPSTPGSVTTARPDTTRPKDAVTTTASLEETSALSASTAPASLAEPEDATIPPSPSRAPTTPISTASEAVSTTPLHSESPSAGATSTTPAITSTTLAITSTTPGAPDPTSAPTQQTTNANTTAAAGNQQSVVNIMVIGVIIACILLSLCVIGVALTRKKKRGRQNFGSQSDRTKKKAADADVWAGPVKLGGGDKASTCDELDEGLGQEEDKDTDGTKVMLSTFVAPEENGGVGRPGSTEVQKWEEREPLLYIDAEAKTEGKKEEDGGNADGAEKTDEKKPLLNGGEAFCLTTAV